MSYDDRVVIERADNGYTVEMRDPAIVAANRKRDMASMRGKGAMVGEWQDPQKTYVFTTMQALTTFLTANLDKALKGSDYSSTFDAMSGEPNED